MMDEKEDKEMRTRFFEERHYALDEDLPHPWYFMSVIYGGKETVGIGVQDKDEVYLIAVEVDPAVEVQTPDGEEFIPGEDHRGTVQ